MYDDYDHRSHERHERDHFRRRSPSSRDHHRSRHDSSRSPRRTPPKGPRGNDPYRDQGQPDRHGYAEYSDRGMRPENRSRHDRDRDRDRDHSGAGAHRRRDSPGYGRSPERGRDRDYRDRYGSGDRGHRSPRDYSPDDAYDDGYYRDGGYHAGPGRPYHTIKMDDIPDSMSAQEVEDVIRDMGGEGLVEVRIKSDARSGDRRCYGFAEFKTDEDCIAFVDHNYPTFEFTASDGTHARVPIAYSRERRSAAKSDDWQCTMCHFENFSRRETCKQCKAPRASENVADMHLDGQSDECPQQTPSQFLVIRDLPSSISETILATGMKKLYVAKEDEPKQHSSGPVKLKSTAPVGNTSGLGAKPGSLARVFMVRERYSDAGCRYGFAEFSNIDDARAAMAKFNASPQFTIGSKAVTVAYIHSGVFIPYLKPVSEQDRKFTFAATHNPSLRLSYWNPSVYACEFTVFDEGLYEEKSSEKPGSTPATRDSKDSKKRKADKDLATPSGKKTIAMAPQLAKWANKHAELYGATAGDTRDENMDEAATPATGANSLGANIELPASSAPPPLNAVSYADLDQMCCLLCRRKFISEASLRRHEQLSDMHKTNLEDEALIEKATRDLKALGKEPTSNYRDRAKERRMAHNQPNKPKPKPARKQAHASKEIEPKDTTPSKPTISKGAGLLAKMGWSAGAGLGAEGDGRTSIIETMAYTPGVGLGAEGGKLGDAAEEAARATKNNYADFVTKAKDKARQRYESMG